MTRFVLRLFVVLAMMMSPAMASWMAMPSMAEAHHPLGSVLDEASTPRCLPPSSACSFCRTCLAVVQGPADGLEVAHRDNWPSASADVLAGIPGSPEPIPP